MADVSWKIVFCAVLVINNFALATSVQCRPYHEFAMGGICKQCRLVCPYGNDWRMCKQFCPEVHMNLTMKVTTINPPATQQQLTTKAIVTTVENLPTTLTESPKNSGGTIHTTVQHPVVTSGHSVITATIKVGITLVVIFLSGVIILIGFLVYKLCKPRLTEIRSGHHPKDDGASSILLTSNTSTTEHEIHQSGMRVNFTPHAEQVKSPGPETDDEMLNADPDFDTSVQPNDNIPQNHNVGDITTNMHDIPVQALNDVIIADVHQSIGSSHLITIPEDEIQVGRQPMSQAVHSQVLQRQYSAPVHTVYSTSPVHNNIQSPFHLCHGTTTQRPSFLRQSSCPPSYGGNDMDPIINRYGSDTTRCVNEKGSYDNDAFHRIMRS